MAAGYVLRAEGGDINLSAATAKTILNVINAANGLILLAEFSVSFDGTSSTAEPVLVELCSSTQATAGTSSAGTYQQIRGATRTVQATGRYNYTAEPTVLTPWKHWLVPAYNGSMTIQFPLGREPQQTTTADGLCIRCTAPAAVNVIGYMEIEEG